MSDRQYLIYKKELLTTLGSFLFLLKFKKYDIMFIGYKDTRMGLVFARGKKFKAA